MGKKFNAFFIFLISFGRVKVTILIHQPSWKVTIDEVLVQNDLVFAA